jgi:hypothetical protein
MTDVLERNSYDDGSVEARRLVAIVAVVIVLAGAWHGLRGTIVRGFGAASGGCYGRDVLVRAALRQAGFDITDADQLRAHSLPRPGWIAWSTVEYETLRDRSQRPKSWQTTVVDGRLRLLGKLPTSMDEPPMDIDGDGRWEARVTIPALDADPKRPLVYHAVLRMGATANEIIWLGLVDDSSWRARGTRVFPKWEDTDGDGVQELVFITVVTVSSPSGGIVFKPPEIVASFKLDRPGGILRPETLPKDCGITQWNPPSHAPVSLDQEADLESVFRELLPVPKPAPQ